MDQAEQYGVKVRFNLMLKEVRKDTILCHDMAADQDVELLCDSLLLAAGLRPRKKIVDALRHAIPETDVFVVGDARVPQSIATAVGQGFGAASEI